MKSLEVEKIVILSGEGEIGTFELYTGKRTERALKTKLKEESCDGDRWVRVFCSAGEDYALDSYFEIDRDTFEFASYMRTIPEREINVTKAG